MASYPVYQFYAELKYVEPKIWRRFQIGNNVPFSKLAYVIMTMFEMQANHLFRFEIPNVENFLISHSSIPAEHKEMVRRIFEENGHTTLNIELYNEDVDFENTASNLLADKTLLRHVVNCEGQRLLFEYDFGDGWEVDLKLEKIIYDKELPAKSLPRVIEGEGCGIIEDCGGPLHLMDMDKAFKEKSGEDYEMFRKWYGKDKLDLVSFDLDDINFRLKKVPRIYKELYEDCLAPTPASMKILERKYKK